MAKIVRKSTCTMYLVVVDVPKLNWKLYLLTYGVGSQGLGLGYIGIFSVSLEDTLKSASPPVLKNVPEFLIFCSMTTFL